MAQLAITLVPYQTSIVPLEDHWKHTYAYSSNNDMEYSIESYGKDGIDGPSIDYSSRLEFERDIIICEGAFTASPDR